MKFSTGISKKCTQSIDSNKDDRKESVRRLDLFNESMYETQ
jgi:hypothetical protein